MQEETKKMTASSYSSMYNNDNSLFGYYDELKAPLIYKKIDNSKFNTIPYNKKHYFAGFFCDLKKLLR